MKRILALAATMLAAGALLLVSSAVAAGPTVANGGGTGSWTPAGVPPASQFGFGVKFLGGASAAGHFECLMAGRSAFPGFQFMAVEGRVTAGTSTATAATFTGTGTGTLLYKFVDGDGRIRKADVTFSVNVTEGGPGIGTLQLTVTGVPFVPGGVAAFPPEWVSSGQIKIH